MLLLTFAPDADMPNQQIDLAVGACYLVTGPASAAESLPVATMVVSLSR